jgi:putative tryptophan/tyrosine transport system substrate-binding protein
LVPILSPHHSQILLISFDQQESVFAAPVEPFFDNIDPDRPSARARQCIAAPRFRTIQVCPKDRLTVPPAGSLMRQTARTRRSLGGMIGCGGTPEGAPMHSMRRREFVSLLAGAAAAWPVAARAQQSPMPVVGFLETVSPSFGTRILAPFRQGLGDSGYVEGQNVAIEYRWAEGRYDRLPELAADLVRRQVNLIVTTSTPASLAAKAATTELPLVFGVGDDPVKLGLVASLNRPGGNATGINFFLGELAAKRLGLLRELAPAATRIAVLVNPTDAVRTESNLKEVDTAARAIGLQVHIVNASTIAEIDAAFATMVRERLDAIFVVPDSFFNSRRVQLANLAARFALPSAFGQREYCEVGGLMSYGTNLADARRQIGSYAGRILKGARAADLPVVQATNFELVVNLTTARMLGLTVPDKLLATADEVIE